jgi:hypothetical protein
MNRIVAVLCSLLLAISVAGCVGKAPPIGKGKGKAPPAPVMTKG